MSRLTRAALLHAVGGQLSVETIEAPDPGPGEVLVRNLAAGVCHSDEAARTGGGYGSVAPLILGHEGAGVIEAVGPGVDGVAVGDTVIGNCAPSCGTCFTCMTGSPILCEESPAIWAHAGLTKGGHKIPGYLGLGTFSELMTVHERCVVKIEPRLPFDELALFGCAVQTGLGAVFNAAKVQAGDTVAIVGLGGIGQVMVQGARIARAGRIIGIDPSSDKREAARMQGATDLLAPAEIDVVDEVRALTNGRGVDFAFEAVGKGSTMRSAWAMTRIGGAVIPVGVGGSDPIDILPTEFVTSGRTWRPSLYCEGYPRLELPRFLGLAERGELDLTSMISCSLPIERINDALVNLGDPKVIRTAITF